MPRRRLLRRALFCSSAGVLPNGYVVCAALADEHVAEMPLPDFEAWTRSLYGETASREWRVTFCRSDP